MTDLASDIAELLRILPARLQRIIRLRHGLDGAPLTYRAIATEIGISLERTRQLYLAAMRRLRREVERRGLAG